MSKRKILLFVLCIVLAFSLLVTGCASQEPAAAEAATTEATDAPVQEAEESATPAMGADAPLDETPPGNDGGFAGGSGTADDPWQIADVEQLELVREDLAGHYLLAADLDLSNYENFTPIGAFAPVSDAPEDEENADESLAFSGTFDGSGHTVSSLAISLPDGMGVGLFGCVSGDNASVQNLTVENAVVEGGMTVGAVIGYANFSGTLENVSLTGESTVTGGFLVGGIVGGGFCSFSNCSAQADVNLVGDNAQAVGILAGGMELSSFENCRAAGTVTATSDGAYSVGGLAGCGQESGVATNCTADATITVGENAAMVGGLLGHAGTCDEATPTRISNCTANVTIIAPESAERIGGIVGSGFYMSAIKEMRPVPGIFEVVDSSSSGSIEGGSMVGTIVGYTYTDSTVEGCTSDATIDGQPDGPQIGSTGDDVLLDDLK